MTKYKIYTRLSALILPSLMSTVVSGQESRNVDELIITGTRIPTKVDNVAGAVSLITSEDIELGQLRLLSDALLLSPGVQVNRSGSFGGFTSVSIRGLPSGLTKFVIDGVELNDPSTFQNGFDFSNFETGDIERIEVLRGAQSTLYGSDAVGGVINVVTRSLNHGLEADGYVEGGSFGTVRGSATVRGGVEHVQASATLSGSRTDGISSADKANGNNERDGARYLNFSSKIRILPIEDVTFEAVLRYRDTRSEFDDFDFLLGPVDAPNVSQSEEWVGAGTLIIDTFKDRLSHRFSFAYNQIDRQDGSTFAFDGQGERLSYEYQGTATVWDGATLIVGAERENDKSLVREGFGASDEIHITSGFGLAQVDAFDWLSLSLGLRHDANSRFGGETTASGGGVIHFNEDFRLRGSYQEGFRAPTTSELSFNPDLKAELSTGWDVGFEHVLYEDRITLSTTYFRQNITDLIAFDLASFNFSNLEAFKSKGVEFQADVRLLDELSFKGSYTHINAQNQTTQSRALRQPENRASLTLNYNPFDALHLSTAVHFNGAELDVGQVQLPHYTVVSLRAAYKLQDRIEVFGRIENLTDKNYQDIDGFGTPGASAYAGVRVRI